MKKLISAVLVLVMLLSMSAFAAEINWADLETNGAEMIAKGEFVTLEEIGVKLWIPTAFAPVELSDEDKESGYIACYSTEDGAYAVYVVYSADEMTLEEYKATAADYGMSEIEDAVVNGMAAVTYKYAETDNAAIAFMTEAGYIIEVSGGVMSDEGFAQVFSFIAASIQVAE